MKKTSALWIALAFLVVALPLAWGLYRSIMNSKPLFAANNVAPPAAAPAATAANAPATGPAPVSSVVHPSAIAPIRVVVPTAAPAAPASGSRTAPPPDS